MGIDLSETATILSFPEAVRCRAAGAHDGALHEMLHRGGGCALNSVEPTPFEQADSVDPGAIQGRGLTTVVQVLRRTWALFLGFLVVGGLLGLLVSSQTPKRYRSTAALNFAQNNFDAQVLGNNYVQQTNNDTGQLATNEALATLGAVQRRAAAIVGGGMTAQLVKSNVNVTDEDGSSVEDVIAEASSPAAAARLANAYATAFVQVNQSLARSALTTAATSLRSQIASARSSGAGAGDISSLQTLLNRVTTLSALQTGGAQIVDRATPPSRPFSPRPKLDVAFGAILGLLFAGLLASLGTQFDRRIRDVPTLETLALSYGLGHGLLGTIEKDGSFAESAPDGAGISARAEEAFRLLQARLRYLNAYGPKQLVAVVSASEGEGKSTVSLHLARTYAQSGVRVLIVDADLRRAQLSERCGLGRSNVGLTDCLVRANLDPAAIARPLRDQAAHRDALEDGFVLDVLPAGGFHPDPARLLQTDRMTQLLRAMRERWDLVILDTPPIEVVSDAMPLLPKADGVLIVARVNVARQEQLRRLSQDLARLGARVLGVVGNAARPARLNGQYSRYYEGWEPPPDVPLLAPGADPGRVVFRDPRDGSRQGGTGSGFASGLS